MATSVRQQAMRVPDVRASPRVTVDRTTSLNTVRPTSEVAKPQLLPIKRESQISTPVANVSRLRGVPTPTVESSPRVPTLPTNALGIERRRVPDVVVPVASKRSTIPAAQVVPGTRQGVAGDAPFSPRMGSGGRSVSRQATVEAVRSGWTPRPPDIPSSITRVGDL